jgi:hypothetical protein
MIVLAVSTNSFAWYEKNPDHRTSLGISVGLGGSAGDIDVKSSGVTASTDTSSGTFDITLDLTAPLSDNLSLFGGVSLFGTTSEADETAVLNGQEVNEGGVNARIGLRIYLGD